MNVALALTDGPDEDEKDGCQLRNPVPRRLRGDSGTRLDDFHVTQAGRQIPVL